MSPRQTERETAMSHPRETSVLFGHREAETALLAAYRSGRIPHAWLIGGPQGIGKATLAFHMAHHLLRYPDFKTAPDTLAVPDPTSSLFRQIATGAHPSVLHLTRPANDKTKSFKTVLTVDEIRKVSRFLSMTSHDGSYRIVIVDPADDMNTNAANALLKNLEEPPARTLFILVVHAPGSLLPTIRSRCQMVRLAPLAADELMAVLENVEPPPPDDPAARAALAERAGGSARNAILLTQYGGLEIAGALDTLVAARKPDIVGAHRLAEAVAGRDQAIQFDIFNRRALDLLSSAASEAALAGDLARAKTLSEAWHEALNTISEAETYNLDKKQHALTMIDRLNSVMRM